MDVEDGQEVRPHHYIRSILPGGPIGINAVLKSGDELLEVSYESSMCGTFLALFKKIVFTYCKKKIF